MALLDLHVGLAETNKLLGRIADALERLAPPAAVPDPAFKSNKISLSDISFLDDETAREIEHTRLSRAMNPRRLYDALDKRAAGSEAPTPRARESAIVGVSSVGDWDHDDPLDAFSDQLGNFAGTP